MLLGLLHAPLGLNLGPRILSINGSSIVTVGLECEYTDCQASNPTSLEWCSSFALISLQISHLWICDFSHIIQPSPASTSSAPISSPNPHQPPIPYPSRLNKEKLQGKDDIQIYSFLQMFKKIHFNISFSEALAYMPKFAKMVKDLLTNKEKLLEIANTPVNENCSAVMLKKLPEKLEDTGRFLIPCEFYGLESCMALADLGASINLMPLSVWKTLSLLELSTTRMTIELATRTVAIPEGIAEDIFIQVGKFTFPTEFVVVDYEVDPRVPLILGRPFLSTARALVDVHGKKLTLRVGDEELVFNVESASKHPQMHSYKSIHKINILDTTCKDHFHEVLNNHMSGSPTISSDPMVESFYPSLTPFRDSDFLLEETDAFLSLDDSIPPGIDDGTYDSEGDIIFLERLLNDDPTPDLPPIPHPICLINDIEKIKSSIDDPPDLELKDLPSHLEYDFLEGTYKLPVIIAKNLKREEKEQLLKILMEDDFKPAIQHQRRVNPKIHEVIKAEVIKLLDAGLIYPISDSPWVSPIHVVPKKGGMTVITNENNKLIPTRLVTGWRVCIDYRKLNDATHKDHFPLLFMDQMLERLARNEFYYFLDGFSGYFQIPIDPQDQEKTTFTCPYGTCAYRQMPFGLCNAPGTFQRCMMVIFHDMIEKTMEVFMDDFSVFGDSFSSCLYHLDTMLQRCEDTNLVLNWEKCHFIVKEGIVLGHKISKYGLKVDKAKLDMIVKLPPLTRPIYYASKTLSDAQTNYTVTEKELMAVVYAFKKFRSYLVLSKTIVYTDHSALKYLFNKQDVKPRLIRWILLLQEFTIEIRDKNGAENLAADHLSRLENPYQRDSVGMEINDNFPHKSLNMISLNPDNKPPWFADIANYLVGNVLVKGILFDGVWTARKLWSFSKLAIMDPPGDTITRTTPRKKFLTMVFSGPPFTAMPRTLSRTVTRVSVRGISHNRTKCPKILFRFVRFLTSGASISWGCSRLQEGTDIFSWLSTIFGTPWAIISDRGTHFCNDQFSKVLKKYGVTHRLSTSYHPQTSGQVEVSNRGLKRILERTIGEHRARWADKLDDALWAFRTAFKTPIGCTPYKLVYKKACHLPIELNHKAYQALKWTNFDLKIAGDHRKNQLNELNELQDQAYKNSLIYKEKTKRIHDAKIKNHEFHIGECVLLFNSRLKMFSGKLKSRWTRPFTVAQVFPYGTIELSQSNGPNFKVNGHRLKHYFGGDIPPMVVLYLQTFPMD
ncbi:reverse transcriptase domain-containing protein [Tanacetum coccineum]